MLHVSASPNFLGKVLLFGRIVLWPVSQRKTRHHEVAFGSVLGVYCGQTVYLRWTHGGPTVKF